MSANQIYRQSKLGDALVEALDQMVMDEKIPGELATKILSEVNSFCIDLCLLMVP